MPDTRLHKHATTRVLLFWSCPKRGRLPLRRGLAAIREIPQSPKTVLNENVKRIGKTVSPSTVKRLARRSGLRWKRMRRSLKARRDERAFRIARDEIHELVQCHKRREIDLYFFDEAGFSLVPTVPYAWQCIGERLEIPSRRSRQLNVRGFLGMDQRFSCYTIEGCVDSWCVVGGLHESCKTLVNSTVVIVDNASVNRSALFEAKISQWADKGLCSYFLPPYSPTLNFIERLWRMIKYRSATDIGLRNIHNAGRFSS